METIYSICAIVGGTVLLCQFVMTLLGFGGEHDAGGHDFGGHDFGGHDLASHAGNAHTGHDAEDHDTQSAWFVGVLSFRTIVAALTFFGLTGLAANQGGIDHWTTLGLAIAAGAGAMFLVAYMMQALHKLKAEGTARIERAIGATGTVYLTIPGKNSGVGKVTLSLQNRTMEYHAVTFQDDLPTGTKVVAVAVVKPGTVEVVPAGDSERLSDV